MELVIDTHALHWLLTDSKSLSKTAAVTIDKASQIYIPSIVLMEAFYIARKHNQSMAFRDFSENIAK